MRKAEILERKTIFQKDWIKIVSSKLKFSNGNIVNWLTPVFGDSVSIVAIDEKKNVLVKEWRVGWDKEVLMTPAGYAGEDTSEKGLLKQARNELREELNLDAKKIVKLGTLMPMVRIFFRQHIFLAQGLYPSVKEKDPLEFVKVYKMPLDKALKIFLSGKEITTAYTVAGLFMAKEKLKL